MEAKKLFSKFTLALALLAGVYSNANNVRITDTSVSGSMITFSISWDNSWNANVAPANWDAVWVFIKYQDCNTRLWSHAGLSTLSADHTAASPLQADAVADGKGVFLRRSAIGGGNINNATITLKMTIPAGTYNYKVFGIEMVNVPQAAFDLGDGTSTLTFNSITVNAASQSGGITSSTIGGGAAAVPATFPMGYNSFYVMKYEISQLQYVEFLNALTYDQQKAHTFNDPISPAGTYAMYAGYQYRNGIRIAVPGNNAAIPAVFVCDATPGVEDNNDDGQSIAVSGLSWSDLSAYLDWAALRPMTELEYEKACRGTMPRVAGEYPWGTTTIENVHVYDIRVINELEPNEGFLPAADGACVIASGTSSALYGPLKVGVFASGTSGRASAGAAFYGAMEMAGNVNERVITVANTTGTAFNGTLGDGTITAAGLANQATWPSPSTAVGVMSRGGHFYSLTSSARISNRITAVDANRDATHGGRGVR